MLRFDRATYLSLLSRLVLSLRLSNSLLGLDVLLFFHKYSIHFCIMHLLNSLYCYSLF